MTDKINTVGLTPALDKVEDLVHVLELVRSGQARTRPEVGAKSGLGRAVVTQRLAQLMSFGLIREGALGPSTGGRAPRQLIFCADAGYLLVAELGATSISVGVSDLSGELVGSVEESSDIGSGPDMILRRTEEMLDGLISSLSISSDRIWGVGIGVPGPVEYATGRPVSPPIMPGWDGYDIRGRVAAKFDAPVWVDNDVNLMALGELRSGLGRGHADLLYVKIGSGIGAGLVADGHLLRGAQGCAGDIGHIAAATDRTVTCRCGNTNCLEALAGGVAIARDAKELIDSGSTGYLGSMSSTVDVGAHTVAAGAARGDRECLTLITEAGSIIGRNLAQHVNFFNPSLVVIGGGVADSGDNFLAAIRQAVYARSTPLATRDLRIARSPLSKKAGLAGAAAAVTAELFSPNLIPLWIEDRTPHGRTDLTDAADSLLDAAG